MQQLMKCCFIFYVIDGVECWHKNCFYPFKPCIYHTTQQNLLFWFGRTNHYRYLLVKLFLPCEEICCFTSFEQWRQLFTLTVPDYFHTFAVRVQLSVFVVRSVLFTGDIIRILCLRCLHSSSWLALIVLMPLHSILSPFLRTHSTITNGHRTDKTLLRPALHP